MTTRKKKTRAADQSPGRVRVMLSLTPAHRALLAALAAAGRRTNSGEVEIALEQRAERVGVPFGQAKGGAR